MLYSRRYLDNQRHFKRASICRDNLCILNLWPFECRLPYRCLTHSPCLLLLFRLPPPSLRAPSFTRRFASFSLSLPFLLPPPTPTPTPCPFLGSPLIPSQTQRLCSASPQTPASSPRPWNWTGSGSTGTTSLSSPHRGVSQPSCRASIRAGHYR